MNVACFLSDLRKIEDKNRILACSPCVLYYYVSRVDITKDYIILRTSWYSTDTCSLRSLASKLINLGIEQLPVLIAALGNIYNITEIDSRYKTIILKTALHN